MFFLNKRDTKYGIADLAASGGVSRRTVRYYVRRGLLPAPTGIGRGNHYTQEHLDCLIQIRTWQEEGVSLADIERRIHDDPEPVPIITQTNWCRVSPHPGVELHISSPLQISVAAANQIIESLRHTILQHVKPEIDGSQFTGEES